MTGTAQVGAPEVSGGRLTFSAVRGIATVKPGDDLPAVIGNGLIDSELEPADGDVLVVASKVVSRAEARFRDLSAVSPGPKATAMGRQLDRDPRLLELVLSESSQVSRANRDAVIVRHRLGFVCANAGIDFSNATPPDAADDSGPWVLLLPEDPDASAARLRGALEKRFGVRLAVVISDSHGRPFREGSIGVAIGLSGMHALHDQTGRADRHGRTMEHTITATADQLAASADLVAGQAQESTPCVRVRGLRFETAPGTAKALTRDPKSDLYV